MYKKTFLFIFFIVLFLHVYLIAQTKIVHPVTQANIEPKIRKIRLHKVTIKPKEKEVKKLIQHKIKPKPKKIKKKIVKKKKILKKVVGATPKNRAEKKVIIKKQVKTTKIVEVKKIDLLTKNEKKYIENRYKAMVKKLIEKYKFYPSKSKRMKQEGIVLVKFTILKNGKFIGLCIKKANRHKRLNRASLKIFKSIEKFEKIPEKLGKNSWDMVIPIEYNII